MSALYFAYGSNLLPARLSARCSSSRKVGRARAHGYALDFSMPGADGSGKATLTRTSGAVTPGALYEIADDDLAILDHYEGRGRAYDRLDALEVEVDDLRDRVAAISYVAITRDLRQVPFDWYLALVLAGARHWSLDAAHLERLAAVRHGSDPQPDRRGRSEALAAFAAHGIADYRTILQPAG